MADVECAQLQAEGTKKKKKKKKWFKYTFNSGVYEEYTVSVLR